MEHAEFESILEAYPVRLDNFEGPLDLLLHLIKQSEVNIYDIPIALITTQYLEYIDLMQEMNLDVAGEFPGDGGDAHPHQVAHAPAETRPDPGGSGRGSARSARPATVGTPEVQGCGRVAARARDLAQRTVDQARWTDHRDRRRAPEPEIEVDLFSLIAAFRTVVERSKQRPKVYLPSEQIPIEDRIEALLGKLSETDACGFEDLFADVQTRAGDRDVLALLEMIRLKLVRVFQGGAMAPIRIYKRARPVDAPKPLLDPEQRHAEELSAVSSQLSLPTKK